MLEKRSATVRRRDASPVLLLPIFGVRNLHFDDGRLLVFAFFQRDAEALDAVWGGDVAAVSVRPFLEIFVGFEGDFRVGGDEREP